jgi:hypothetical protein
MAQQTLFAKPPAGERLAGQAYHARMLVTRLGNGADWEYTGDCMEDATCSGTCACRHTGLRWQFIIRNPKTGDTAIVGSRCILTFQNVNPDMVARIQADADRLEREAAERLKAARELAAQAEVEAAIGRFDMFAWELAHRLAQGAEPYTYKSYDGTPEIGYKAIRRVAGELWRAGWTPDHCARVIAGATPGDPGRYPKRWKAYKSRSAFLKHIAQETEFVERWANSPVWM